LYKDVELFLERKKNKTGGNLTGRKAENLGGRTQEGGKRVLKPWKKPGNRVRVGLHVKKKRKKKENVMKREIG